MKVQSILTPQSLLLSLFDEDSRTQGNWEFTKYFRNKLCIWWKQILMNWCYITSMNKYLIVKSFDIETLLSRQAMYLLADYFIDWKAFMYHT